MTQPTPPTVPDNATDPAWLRELRLAQWGIVRQRTAHARRYRRRGRWAI